jgi:UDP-N-acetylglucosamine--N-acetylmuramyl-(pentapeptide) pyrophosphoryl-undecaprenol N-acetylglucosamine transferase
VTRRNCYFFAGGGTGGHLTPGLAVAAELLEYDRDCRIVFVGSDRPLERHLVAAARHEHRMLPVESSRTLRQNPLRFALRNWRAFRMASALVDIEKPRGVIGLGGFASAPAVVAAIRRRIPTLILEQNVVPGRATRFLSRRVGAVCTSFAETTAKLSPGARVVLTGNPVRISIAGLQAAVPVSIDPPTLLVLGGSQGAESLNEAVVGMLEQHRSQFGEWRIVHQTGASQYDRIQKTYRDLGVAHVVQPFFDDLSDWYARAALAVSRAGATTLAELACAGCPAVLVPYPLAADDHQLANARAYAACGAAVVIEHDEVSSTAGPQLAATVAGLAADATQMAAMRAAMRSLARPDAARNVFEVLQSLMTGPIT